MRRLVLVLIVLGYSTLSFGHEVQDIHRTELFTYGGIPVYEEADDDYKILVNTGYAVGYSENMRNPLWVVYRLGNMKTDFSVPKWERPFSFYPDIRTESRVTHDAYMGSGYDRGHMAPNAAMLAQYGQMAQLETYLMTNICPQTAALNRSIWAKLETKVRDELSQIDTENAEVHDLYVITGPIFESNTPDRLDSGVAIPTSYYKIIAFQEGYRGTIKAIALVFPQEPDSDDLLDYVTTVDYIEDLTGLNFFPKLSEAKQHNLESVERDFTLDKIE